jgi:hypothetical protein
VRIALVDVAYEIHVYARRSTGLMADLNLSVTFWRSTYYCGRR